MALWHFRARASVVRAVALMLAAAGAAVHAGQPAASLHLPPLDRVLPARAESIYAAVATRVDARAAMDVVTFMAPHWRLAGNPAYDRSLDFVAERLRQGGVAHRIESYANSGYGWEQHRGTLALEGATREVVLSRDQDRVAL